MLLGMGESPRPQAEQVGVCVCACACVHAHSGGAWAQIKPGRDRQSCHVGDPWVAPSCRTELGLQKSGELGEPRG